MKRQIGIIMAAWLITSAFLRADTSYLLIQGDFGDGGSTEESFKWEVNYASGSLVTGQDLLNDVFGQPVLTGTYTDAFDGTYPEYQAGSGLNIVDYIYFGSVGGYFPISFTLGGTTQLQDPSYDPSWIYYVAGGGGFYGSDDNGAPYANGSWAISDDGVDTRTLSNGSYDGWVIGDPNVPAPIDDTSGDDAPTTAEFFNTDSTNFFTVLPIPEPGESLLVVLPMAAVAFWKRKGRA
jgi:hypothetical protein